MYWVNQIMMLWNQIAFLVFQGMHVQSYVEGNRTSAMAALTTTAMVALTSGSTTMLWKKCA
jgi:hypothetical protein